MVANECILSRVIITKIGENKFTYHVETVCLMLESDVRKALRILSFINESKSVNSTLALDMCS